MNANEILCPDTRCNRRANKKDPICKECVASLHKSEGNLFVEFELEKARHARKLLEDNKHKKAEE